MEYHIVLTNKEAAELSEKLTFLHTDYVKDVYTGKKRIRTEPKGVSEKEYETPVTGTIHRFSSLCKLGDIEKIWFELRWTDKKTRFEVEFETEVPEEYQGREKIRGWDILKE